jgi:hypothetical protein
MGIQPEIAGELAHSVFALSIAFATRLSPETGGSASSIAANPLWKLEKPKGRKT